MPAQDLSTQFDADWQKAQERYQKYVNAGLSEADAAKLFIAPVDTMWKLIRASPQTFQDKSKMSKIHSDFENATVEAAKSAFDRNGTDGNNTGSLVQKWMTEVAADKASGKASAYEKRVELSDIRSSIRNANRARTKSGDIVRSGLQGITDPDKLAARKQMLEDNTANVSDLDAQIADLTAQEKTLLSGSTGENPQAQPAAVAPAMPGQPAAAPAMPAGNVFASLGGQSNQNGFDPAQVAATAAWNARFGQNAAPQIDPTTQAPPAEAAPQMPANNRGGIYISDSPELSNQTRAQADAAWAAKFAPRMSPPADTAAVQDASSSYDAAPVEPSAKPTAASKNTPIDSQAAYDALASGDQYYDSKGNLRRKK